MHAVLHDVTHLSFVIDSMQYIFVVGMYAQHVKARVAIKVFDLTIFVCVVVLSWKMFTLSVIPCPLDLIMHQLLQIKIKSLY